MKAKRFFSVFLALALCLSMTPVMSIPASAADNYNLWVGVTQVTSDNAADVLGDGKVSYDASSNTLTLNGFTYSGAGMSHADVHGTYNLAVGIFSQDALTIVLSGTNSITMSGNGKMAGIYGKSSLTIKGDGSLDVTIANANAEVGSGSNVPITFGIGAANALTCEGSVTINSTTNCTYQGEALTVTANGTITLSGSAKVTATATATSSVPQAVSSSGNLILQDSAELTCTGKNETNNYGYGLYYMNVTMSGASKLTAQGNSAGIEGGSNCSIDLSGLTAGGCFLAKSAKKAIDASNPTFSTSGLSVKASTDAEGTNPVTYSSANLSTYKWIKAEPLTTYTVTVTPGDHMTKTESSGAASQTVNADTAITDVVYTADEGYYFPTNYAVDAVNGVSVTRDSYTQITVSGTPTAAASITLTAPTEKTKESTPAASFTATGPDTGTLSNVTSGMTYQIDSGDPVTISDTSVDLIGLSACTIKVVKKGDGETTTDSVAQEINVTKATTPNLAVTQPSVIGGTGSVATATTHEYKADSASSWTTCTANQELAAGSYSVRVKATGTVLASENQTVTITAFTGTREPTPNATFTATGADAGDLTGLTPSAAYTVSGAGLTGGDKTADSNGKIALTGLSAGTLSIVKKGDGTTTTDSTAQTITVTKAATPNLTATQPTSASGTGSIPTTAAHEISTDGTAYTACSGSSDSLAIGTYYVRVAATGTALASAPQTIVIKYTAPSSPSTPSAPSTPATVTSIKSGESITASNLDRLVSQNKDLTVTSADGAAVVLDTDALKGIDKATTSSVTVELKDVSSDYAETYPDKAVYDFTVTSGGEEVADFGGAATVTLPYTLGEGENPKRVTVWEVDEAGELVKLEADYDKDAGKLTVTDEGDTATYVVGYEPMPFTDVAKGSYYYEAVDWADVEEITAGTTATTFSPTASATRAETVTFLWRAAGKPEPTTAANPFSDVSESAYYYKAVLWAAENNITAGTGDGRFSPNGTITRAQVTTFLYRLEGTPAAGSTPFTDVESGSYYEQAVRWAYQNELTSGTSDTTFSPADDCLRGQIVTFLYRYFEA